MELDLIAGLTMPKTAPNAAPTLEITQLPAEEFVDFSILIENTEQKVSQDLENVPEQEFTRQMPMAETLAPALVDPQKETLEIEVAPKVELENIPDISTLPANLDAPSLPKAPFAPVAKQAEPTEAIVIASPHTLPAVIISATQTTATSDQAKKTDTDLPSVVTSQSAAVSEMQVKQEQPVTFSNLGAIISPTEPPTSAATVPPAPAEKPNNSPPSMPIEHSVEPRVVPEKIQTNSAVTLPTQTSPTFGLEISEGVTKDPAEVQFSVKIDRQPIDNSPITRPSTPAAPLANQISAQLPQLLTKADKQTIELRLDPPELGRVTIHLSTNDTQITAQVVADRVDTVDLMRRHAELLSATLARAGFSQSDLSFHQGQSKDEDSYSSQNHNISGESVNESEALPSPLRVGQDGRLDIRL